MSSLDIDWLHEYSVDYLLTGRVRPRAWIVADVLRERFGRVGWGAHATRAAGDMDDYTAPVVAHDPVARVALARALTAVPDGPDRYAQLRRYLVSRSRGHEGRMIP